MQPAQYRGSLGNDIYISATTLFTLSTGDPRNPVSRVLSACEGGLGLSFLGLVIAYLPILYQSFSRRELRISLLDAPPSASALLYSAPRSAERLERQLVEWEEWAAQLLENHLSFPVLAYFRSHHANQSWLAALVAVLDTVAVVTLCSEDDLRLQARLTFAMGRHALADIAALFPVQNKDESVDRLPHQDFLKLGECLSDSDSPLSLDRLSESELAKLRRMYEPHAAALSGHFLVALPPWIGSEQRENWKRTAADPRPDPFAVSDPFSGRRA